MTIPIWVEQTNGKYTASVLGSPLHAHGETNEAAVLNLRAEIDSYLASKRLVLIDIESSGLLSLGNKYKDDPGWQQVWDDIKMETYRYRDELKAQEFPE